jgi:hypothetical protein
MNAVSPNELKPSAVLKRYKALAELYTELKAKAVACKDEALKQYAQALPDTDNPFPKLEPIHVEIVTSPTPKHHHTIGGATI